MRILAVETSGKSADVAILEGATILAERQLPAEGGRHARSLVGAADELLRTAGIPPAGVDAVAVGIGPGSFTGLRVGVVFAKTWCYATGAKLVAVDTLQAAAEQSPAGVERVHAVADAQRGDLYVGEYVRSDAGLTPSAPVQIANAGGLAAGRSPDDLVTGPGLERYASLFAGRCRVAPSSEWSPRAVTIGRLGLRQAAVGEFADQWTIEPFYLRRSAAEEKRDAAGA